MCRFQRRDMFWWQRNMIVMSLFRYYIFGSELFICRVYQGANAISKMPSLKWNSSIQTDQHAEQDSFRNIKIKNPQQLFRGTAGRRAAATIVNIEKVKRPSYFLHGPINQGSNWDVTAGHKRLKTGSGERREVSQEIRECSSFNTRK